MTMLADIKTVLTAACPRVFPLTAPLTTPRPYVTYQPFGGIPLVYVEGTVPDKRHAFLQVNVWADTLAQADALSLQIDAAMRTTVLFQCDPMTEAESQDEPDMNLYGMRQDFSILATRA